MTAQNVVFIGMETSGEFRRRFQERGYFTVSVDTLPAEDGAGYDEGGLGGHLQMDVFEALEYLAVRNRWPRLALFHITCTYLTNSAAWAFNDPDYERYPGVGYHQKPKPGTLVGEARRAARERSKEEFRRVQKLRIKRKIVENPVGALSSIRKPCQIVQPYQFGDDASKGTCFWFMDEDGNPVPEMRLPIDPAKRCPGRWVPVTKAGSQMDQTQNMSQNLGLFETTPRDCGMVERWSNQTDSGQNKLTPGENRWKDRSRTFPGIADAGAGHWAKFL